MSKVAVSKVVTKRNGRKPDPEKAREAVEEAFAYKRRMGGFFKGLTRREIIARIKKIRYKLFEERFAPRPG